MNKKRYPTVVHLYDRRVEEERRPGAAVAAVLGAISGAAVAGLIAWAIASSCGG
jgi:hypothetical protein